MNANEVLMDRLRDLANRVDPPPETVREGARWAFSWRTADVELAELEYDSSVEAPELAGVRATDSARLLTFHIPLAGVEVEVSGHGSQRMLIGQLVPAQEARIDVRHRDGVTQVTADELGRFTAEGVPAGPVSLRCTLQVDGDTRVVDTDWVTL